jgi:drug/metabolite transporter (DMT)-like permease
MISAPSSISSWFQAAKPRKSPRSRERVVWTPRLVALLSFSGLACTALAHWAMLMVNRSLPAVTTSLGLLATPAIGIVCGAVALGEAFDPSLSLALVLIAGGVATGIVSDRPRSR